MTPRLSIGLPVFNGAAHLREAVDSLLAQSFRDFELILCDNASTDATDAICRGYARHDERVRHYRSPRNRGACCNFNWTVELARGQYFKWAAHDDWHAPEYLERCVAALDADPSLVGCHTHVRVVDGGGAPLLDHIYPPGHASSPDPVRRFADMLREDRWGLEFFGVFRTSVLRRTGLLGAYVASDRTLRAHLGLLGRLHTVPEPLFFNRDHPDRSIRRLPAHHMRVEWYDPAQAGRRVFPHWRILGEYARLLRVGELSRDQRRRGRMVLLRWLGQDMNWARLGADLVIAVAPGAWRILARVARQRLEPLAAD